jgi:glycerate 2-kinase
VVGHVVVCPDSFKGTLTATQVADALAEGLRAGGLEVDTLPAADGGEGTLAALGGEVRREVVSGPLGHPVEAEWSLLPDGRAVVEAAQASGLGLVPELERDAWAASTRGTGELIVAAARAGASEVLVAVGGTATTDGGAGAVAALDEAEVDVQLTVLCDVQTAWEDAPHVFGPQKGADLEMVARLEWRLEALAARAPHDPRGVPMTGAGGGLSGGLWAFYSARVVRGAAFVLDAIGLDDHLRGAVLCVTGEGRLDEQTLAGKVVAEVAARCERVRVPCHAVVGRDELGTEALGLASVREAGTLAELAAAGEALAGGGEGSP